MTRLSFSALMQIGCASNPLWMNFRCRHRLFQWLLLAWAFAPSAWSDAVAIVDIGSTGSRFHLYRVTLPAVCHFLPTSYGCLTLASSITSPITRRITPGLATLPATADAIMPYFNRLFQSVQQPSLDVYVLATAGMRLSSQLEQRKRWHWVVLWFKHHPRMHLQQLKVISGEEEAFYGWFGVNFIAARLGGDAVTLPVTDFGGASVEVAYQYPSWLPLRHAHAMAFAGNTRALYLRSYLGLGWVQFQKQLIRVLHSNRHQVWLRNGELTDCAQLMNAEMRRFRLQPVVLQGAVYPTWMVLGGMGYFVRSQWPQFHSIGMSLLQWQAGLAGNAGKIPNCIRWAKQPAANGLLAEVSMHGLYYWLALHHLGLPVSTQLRWPSSFHTQGNGPLLSGDWTLGAAVTHFFGVVI